jgi:triacylglycerol lipase
MSTIVLAHGILGFAELIPGFSFINYFNGVQKHLERQGHVVIAPAVNPIGSIETRARELVNKVLQSPKVGTGMHVIAHSMGGLDTRQALATNTDFRQRIVTLVTIGTPHRGSKVANAVMKTAGPLLLAVPSFLKSTLHDNAGAIEELTTGFCEGFNQRTTDITGIRYIEVAGDKSKTNAGFSFFELAARIGGLDDEVNDGVVAKSSALRDLPGHLHLDDWPVDHVGEIGWSKDSLAPIDESVSTKLSPAAQQHLARYGDIVSRL